MLNFDDSTSALEEAAASCWRRQLRVGGGSLLLEDLSVACWRRHCVSIGDDRFVLEACLYHQRRYQWHVGRGVECPLEEAIGSCWRRVSIVRGDISVMLEEASSVHWRRLWLPTGGGID